MRVFTLGLLQCTRRECEGGLSCAPLSAAELAEVRAARGAPDWDCVMAAESSVEAAAVPAFLERLAPFSELERAVSALELESVPAPDAARLQSPAYLAQLREFLFCNDFVEGYLNCERCGAKFRVSNGIPDFIENLAETAPAAA